MRSWSIFCSFFWIFLVVAMYSMAGTTSAMLVRPDSNFVSCVRSGGHASLRMRAPGLALRGSRVQVCLRREVRGGNSLCFRSAFLAPRFVVQRKSAVFGRGGIREFKRHSFVVRAGGKSLEEGEEVGVGEAFEKLEESSGSGVEILPSEHGSDNLSAVEDIEVTEPSRFSVNLNSSFDSVELEVDVVHQSTRQQPKLVKFLRKFGRFLNGLQDKEDAMLELSSSTKQKKLRWDPLGFLNGSTPSVTEKLRNKVFDGLRRAEDDFFAVRGILHETALFLLRN